MANPHQPGTIGAYLDEKYHRKNQQHTRQPLSLDPSLPSFQPGDMRLQHYQPPHELTPFQSALQTTPTAAAFSEMQRRMLEMDTYHNNDIVKLTRQVDAHGEAIEETRKCVTNDIRTLERRIDDIAHQQQQQSATKVLGTKDDRTPSEQMLDMFSKEKIAGFYLDEANEKEALAEKLREQAGLLWPDCIVKPEAQAAAAPVREVVPAHFICETNDAIMEVMAVHIDDVQARHERVDSANYTPDHPGAFATGQKLPHMCCEIAYVQIEDMISHIQHSHAKLLKPNQTTSTKGRSVDCGTQTEVEIAKDGESSAPSTDDVSSPAKATSTWRPLAIRNLDLLSVPGGAASHDTTFDWTFLRELLGGQEWSPGYYFNSHKGCILPARGYWLVDGKHEPFMPHAPGQHGVKLSAFMNETTEGKFPQMENYMETPVFVSADGGKTYRYMGMYSQTRFSDKVGYDTLMEHIPEAILHHHAEQLAKVGRPAWVTENLKNHFWPKPVYAGPVPTDSACNTPKTVGTGSGSGAALECGVKSALEEYALELKEWEKDSAMKVQLLTPEAIFDAFTKEDIQISPGLRLWWEYLQCVEYSVDFYDMLVRLHKKSKATITRISIGPEPTPTFDQIKQAGGESKKAGKSHAKKKSKDGNGWPPAEEDEPNALSDWVSPKLNYPPPALYGAASKALQAKQNREQPGVPLSALGPTRWSTPSFDDNEPGYKPVVEKKTSATAKAASAESSSKTTTQAHAQAQAQPAATKAIPPHLRKAREADAANAVVPASPASNQNPVNSHPAANLFPTANLNEAKSFAQQATAASNRAIPPHMRNK